MVFGKGGYGKFKVNRLKNIAGLGGYLMQNTKKLSIFVLSMLIVTSLLSLYGCEATETHQTHPTYENIVKDENILEKEYYHENIDDNNWQPEGDDRIVMRAGFFVIPHETYYFTLSQNGILEASWGNSLHNTPFEEMKLYEMIELPRHPELGKFRRDDPRYYHHFEKDLVDMLGVVEGIETSQLTRADFDNIIELLEVLTNIPDDQERWGMSFDSFNHGFGHDIHSILLNYNDTLFIFRYNDILYRSSWEVSVINSFFETLLWHSPVQTPEFWPRRMREIEAGIKPLDRWREVAPQG